MKVADYVIDRLADEGVKEMFGVNGSADAYIIDAFCRTNKTNLIAVMHEQAGGFAAEGYAKIKENIGVAISTSGPGAQNLVTPISNFYFDSVPGIFITGQITSAFLRPEPEIRQIGFQESPTVEIVTPVTKYAKMIKNPNSIKYELEKAIFLAKSGRPGPVLLDLPMEVQKAEVNTNKMEGFDSSSYKETYDLNSVDEKIKRYIKDLSKSERPVILVGAGVRHANGIEELLELGDKLKIPMFPTWNALDVVTSDSNYYGGRVGTYGGKGRNFGIQNSDLLLAIGSRISGRITGGKVDSFAKEAKKYVVDVDRYIMQRKTQPVPFDENILCDAKVFLTRIINRLNLSPDVPDFSKWTEKVMDWRDKYDPVRPEYFEEKNFVNPYAFMRTLSDKMKKGDVIVSDCGGNIVVTSHAFETKQGQRLITNNGNSPMGFSFAGAMGAYLASKENNENSNVVCIIGDGGFNMNMQEMQTVKNYNLGFKTFILNNHSYGIIRAYQKTNLEGRLVASGPEGYNPPNFMDIAKAYNIKTIEIGKNDDVGKKIEEVLKYNGPVICDVDNGTWDTYEPRIFGNTPIEDMFPHIDRKEFKENLFIAPYEGWEKPLTPGENKVQFNP
jgi:acetolactate synthase I/II/III large subunit